MRGGARPRGGIASHFVRSLVSVAVGAVVVVWLGLVLIYREAELRSDREVEEARARQVALLIGDYLDAASRSLDILCGTEALGTRPPPECEEALESFLTYAEPVFSQLSVLDGSGKEVAKASRFHTYLAGELENRGGSEAFQTAVGGKKYLSDVYVSNEGGLLSVTLARPLSRVEVEAPRVLLAEVNVTRLWISIAEVRIGDSGYAYLVDSRGRFMAYQDPSTVLQRYGEDMSRMPPVSEYIARPRGSQALSLYRGLTGEEVFGFLAPVAGTQWAIVTELPSNEALADLRRMQVFLVVVGLLGAAISGLIGLAVSSRLTAPISSLIAAAEQLGRGDMEPISLDLGRRDELGILARAFNSMQEKLRSRSEDLAGRLAELTEAKAELARSEAKFRAVFDQTFELMGILDSRGFLLEVNRKALELIGKRSEEVIGLPFTESPWWSPFPEETETLKRALASAARGGVERFEAVHRDAGGKPFHVDFSITPVRDAGGAVALLVAEGRDITQRKEVEEALRSNLREKEVLLKEIHHRVKNNLQVIMSLLNLQSSRMRSREAIRFHEETIARVRTMAQVHELLYQSPSLSEIDLAEQVRLIAGDLYESYRDTFGVVELKIETVPVGLGIDQALPCGLIVNEILSNSFKYAFPPRKRAGGTVFLGLSRAPGGEVSLEISDDGVGIPGDIEFGATDRIGLSLVSLLVGQIGGRIELDRSAGTRYAIRFTPASRQ